LRTNEGHWKQGNTRKRAIQLRKALCESIGKGAKSEHLSKLASTVFADVYDLAIERHSAIESYFGSDAGSQLMRTESRIALDVLFHFAAKGVPVLGVHDSFIVPHSHRDELWLVMHECYRADLGFDPVVK